MSSDSGVRRIWWCMTGPLAFLPIHAAGIYGEHESIGSKLSDFVVSSYTPTLGALLNTSAPDSPREPRILTIAQATASGQMQLPGTRLELEYIRKEVQCFPLRSLAEGAVTVEAVKSAMRESSWVHFACHGVQNIKVPTKSALLVAENSSLTLEDIIRLELPHADLAFLSACQTAMGAEDLEEESVHLAAGMLLAGYRGVIATMWSIRDDDAPEVARDIYGHIFKDSQPDPTRAAEALHFAVKKFRESSKDKSLFSWVPFIHIGA